MSKVRKGNVNTLNVNGTSELITFELTYNIKSKNYALIISWLPQCVWELSRNNPALGI